MGQTRFNARFSRDSGSGATYRGSSSRGTSDSKSPRKSIPNPPAGSTKTPRERRGAETCGFESNGKREGNDTR